ncbi:hypothetical protein [Kosmotoga pacifica]|uniref:Uncharacterized protein n=1 Tax=Kosmotoga pacifica TaxID=1330330 RepID=A0A0G2ZCB6_9BACT|nr:hypothetical protein [Kosmotoga pacifica]AKI97741.1 hypothetical protein IX53_07865 [Kosmotoga pacifica]
MRKFLFLALLVFIGLSLFSNSTWIPLFPELASSPPIWLKEGLRISFYALTATVKPGGGLPENSVSGAGILQVDIVALEEGNVAILQTYYLKSNGQYFPSIAFGGIEKCGLSDYWMNPAVFNHLDRFRTDNSVAAEMPLQIGDKTVQAVRIEYTTDNGKNVYTYEKETGILLYSQLKVPSGGNVQSSHLQLISSRELNLPWKGVSREAGLAPPTRYSGAVSVNIPGTPPTTLPLQVQVTKVSSGKNWDLLKLTVSQYGSLPSEIYNVCGTAQLNGPMWMPITALNMLQQGHILDYDEITRIKTSVTFKGALGSGLLVVIIEQAGDNFVQDYVYDIATGRLIYFKMQMPNGLGYNITELEAVQ